MCFDILHGALDTFILLELVLYSCSIFEMYYLRVKLKVKLEYLDDDSDSENIVFYFYSCLS